MAGLLSKATGEKLLALINAAEGMPVNDASSGGEFKAVNDLHYARLTDQAIDEITSDPIPNMWSAEEVRYDTDANEWAVDTPGFLYYSETAFVIVEDGKSGDVVAINPITVVDGNIFWLGIKGGGGTVTSVEVISEDSFGDLQGLLLVSSSNPIPIDYNPVTIKTLQGTSNFTDLIGNKIYVQDIVVEDNPNIPDTTRTVYYINPVVLH